ncbi:metallothionein-I gene transcription activator [Lasiosphaeris hirsuta]|uniref:Metallothionein-I gene transcription activator n=1 Tax=Lasiosphaeris hirsuta TaxID=260670 RepID=A0AA40DV71_9PEZI|nr:metallothionein-I gene transcription activator [Lasiosphaeris hirsuta]
MSREQYQIPTGSQQTFAAGGSNTVATSTNREFETGIMHYTCGDCAARVPLEKGAAIRCQKCGARVLYKERTKRMVQFEAR